MEKRVSQRDLFLYEQVCEMDILMPSLTTGVMTRFSMGEA
jgi:hypothetical protein